MHGVDRTRAGVQLHVRATNQSGRYISRSLFVSHYSSFSAPSCVILYITPKAYLDTEKNTAIGQWSAPNKHAHHDEGGMKKNDSVDLGTSSQLYYGYIELDPRFWWGTIPAEEPIRL